MITCGCGRYFSTTAEFFAHRDSAECPKNTPRPEGEILKWIVANRKRKKRKPETPADTFRRNAQAAFKAGGLTLAKPADAPAPALSGETAVTTSTRKKSTKAAKTRAPKAPKAEKPFRIPKGLTVGQTIGGEFRGKPWTLTVLEDHLIFNGKRFSSLTAAAESMTGYTVSGPAFFGLWKPKEKKTEPAPAEIPAAAPPAAEQPVSP